MNRQEAVELLPLIEAFIAGETIQYLQHAEKNQALSVWRDIDDVLFTDVPQNYRVKPTPREWDMWITPKGELTTNSDMLMRESVRVREILD